ncbi:MAG: hypothetical protein HQ509_04750 [Candidatus Marinimicrobia bacterium]|nr:hypothetical protein [Candidatus Neomarinimicrobiota bacterium]
MDSPKNNIKQIGKKISSKKFEYYQILSYQIINQSNLGLPLSDFLKNFLNLMVDFSGCSAIEIWIRDNDKYNHCTVSQLQGISFQHEVIRAKKDVGDLMIPDLQGDSIIDNLLLNTIRGRFDPSLPFYTNRGSYWTRNFNKSLVLMKKSMVNTDYTLATDVGYKSIIIIPIVGENENIGLLQMVTKDLNSFTKKEVEFYEGITHILSLALVNQYSRVALRERIKEITCLYDITRVTELRDLSFAEMMQNIANLIPPAWQYPELTSCRIILDCINYETTGFLEDRQRITSSIIVNGKKRGSVEVVYTKDKPELDEGPFLKEERHLINAIARQLSHIVERSDDRENRLKLQEQLQQADRLATIGQLVAGVAHELNEPLNSILGFAQLIKKYPDLPDLPKKDVNKIETASLYAREIIKKLMLFSRQTKPNLTHIDMNVVIKEGLLFFKSRCEKSGIKIKYNLSHGIPKIMGDKIQLNQVLLNLVVNSIQAMPDGGTLTINTLYNNKTLSLIVEDTGIGINKNVINKIFLPFFTTKDINEGTGLGLAVVHGIIVIHKGSIRVESRINFGTRIIIELPLAQ